ncbi:MAG: hypothetical protein B6D37_15830 [Sphingobacteriales bacterium UTBCD1]|jgi:hypothetical protein|nr:MAG: hypothetical protein B6D37_15830 [Sphingobacteriales bacterium UTBCD1]
MKYLFFIFFCYMLIISCNKPETTNPVPPPATDSFTVSINNGYGSGRYKAGDTVHIFSQAYSSSQLFGSWSGNDVSLLNAPDEWHTWFIMPKKNVNFSGSSLNISSFTLNFEKIKGRDRLKPVYYYFPAGHKGIVYLLHGTGGNAAFLVADYEWQLLINDLVNNKFALIVTESEEATTNTDLNSDGVLRWNTTPWDTVSNIDYANIRIITDTFYNRGLTSNSEPKYSIGMSNGGNFSTALSTIYNFRAGVSYCAPSGTPIAQVTNTPLQFCMARFDNNPSVGSAGNANALSNSRMMTGRGICSKYFTKERSPLYPERFARRGDISVSQSAAVFNEIKAAHLLDAKNYFIGYSDALKSALNATPSAFPQLSSLNVSQQNFVITQIDLAVSDHKMYSDFNRATLLFLTKQCQ